MRYFLAGLLVVGVLLATGWGMHSIYASVTDRHDETIEGLCRRVLIEQRTAFDSAGVGIAFPPCWDVTDPRLQPAVRWRDRL